jgi:hypothetical protein
MKDLSWKMLLGLLIVSGGFWILLLTLIGHYTGWGR